MMKLGPFIIMRAAEFPHIQKAHKLARCLTEAELDDILAGRKHLHGNPVRFRKLSEPKVNMIPILGKLNIDNPSDPMNKETMK